MIHKMATTDNGALNGTVPIEDVTALVEAWSFVEPKAADFAMVL